MKPSELTTLQIQAAGRKGETFELVGRGAEWRKITVHGITPSGNYLLAKKASDPAYFGSVCLNDEMSASIANQISARFDAKGNRRYGSDPAKPAHRLRP